MKQSSFLTLFIYRLFVIVFIGCLFDLINFLIYGNIIGQTDESEFTKIRFYSAVFIAPFVETYIFWTIPLMLFKKYVQTKYRYFLVSLGWACSHDCNVNYAISLLLIGIFFWYIYEKSSFTKWGYFFYVSALHSLYNLIVSITNYGLLDKFDLLFK